VRKALSNPAPEGGPGMDDNRGRCVSCGFLARRPVRRDGLSYSGIAEVEVTERESPIIGLQAGKQPENVVVWDFICFRNVADLPAEIQGISTADRANAAGVAFHKDRRCASWFRYEMGFHPKENLMEQRMQNDLFRCQHSLLYWTDYRQSECDLAATGPAGPGRPQTAGGVEPGRRGHAVSPDENPAAWSSHHPRR
jgi:hypothetical protein